MTWTRSLTAALLSVALAGCATGPLEIPASEIEALLAHQSQVGLKHDQTVALRGLLDRSRNAQAALERHLKEEARTLRDMTDDLPVDSPAIRTQAGLVHQLRAEQLLAVVLLREQTREQLTNEQIDWFYRQRVRTLFPR